MKSAVLRGALSRHWSRLRRGLRDIPWTPKRRRNRMWHGLCSSVMDVCAKFVSDLGFEDRACSGFGDDEFSSCPVAEGDVGAGVPGG